MGYIERNLIEGEKLLYETRLHWIVLLPVLLVSFFFDAVGIVLVIEAFRSGSGPESSRNEWIWAAVAIFVVAGIFLLIGQFKRTATEMAVTNKRLVIKRGIMTRTTFELLLSKVESIVVEEPPMGRVLGFGTVIVRGVGGTPEPFEKVARPLEFRKHVQQQIEAGQGK